MDLKLIASSKCFEGEQRIYSHNSNTLKCEMKFGVYIPPQGIDNTKCPVLYFLSGLTCTHETSLQRSGVQQYAAEHGLVIVHPDTSPRNTKIPGEDDSREFGSGASFYLDATIEPWSKHYKMYSYVTKELPELINSNFPVIQSKTGIFGHSMGGHGALICALKNPGMYQSISALAPVANASESPVGMKTYKLYLGTDKNEMQSWDATYLAKKYAGSPLEIFYDQGSVDEYLTHLAPEHFLNASAANDRLKVIYKLRDGYDHSFFYINTFIGEHIAYHAKLLKA